jgi:hypothetical protein
MGKRYLSQWERYERDLRRRDRIDRAINAGLLVLGGVVLAGTFWLAMVGAVVVFGR